MSFSLTSQLFNIESLKFPWKESIDNWVRFLNGQGEIVLVLNKSKDNSDKILTDHVNSLNLNNFRSNNTIRIIRTEFDLSTPFFDGEIKNIGYKACKNELVIPLDLDEVISLDSYRNWNIIGKNLLDSQFDAYIIPSINLYGSWQEYKDIGAKFYMVKNKPYIKRGVVNYAKKEDGLIDISKSDSTEFIVETDNSLINCTYLVPPNLPDFMKLAIIKNGVPFVFHRASEFLEHRLVMNKFWKDIWQARGGHSVDDIIVDMNEFKKIQAVRHNLLHWDIR